MSAKDDLSNNKAKQFFILHGEKVAFGFCLLLVAVFFLLGRGVKGLEEGKTPSALSNRVMSANQHMNQVDQRGWREIEDARKPDFNLTEKVLKGRELIDYTNYISYLNPPALEPQKLRTDPLLLPPSKPQLFAINAALAVPLPSGVREGPLDVFPIAEVVKEEKKPGRTPKKTEPSDDNYGSSGIYGGSGPTGSDAYDVGDSDDESTPMVDASGTKEYRQLTQSILQKLPGFRLNNATGIMPKAYTIVAGTATVPIKDQWLEYKAKFENSIGFDPMRDRPIYMWYEVQRQDVTDSPDGAVDPDAWEVIMFTGTYDDWYRKMRYGAGPAPIVDLAYYEGASGRNHDYALTSPVPIVLLRDVEQFALHPSTPKRKPVTAGETSEPDEADPMADPRFGPSPTGPSSTGPSPSGPATGSGSDGYSSGYDSSDVAGGSGYGETDFVDFDPETGPKADLKLVRFFDVKTTPGRRYQYRVRIAMVDPNNPLHSNQQGTGGTGDTYGESSGAGEAYGSSYPASGSSSAATSTGESSSDTVPLLWLDKEKAPGEKKSVRDRVDAIQKADIAKHGARFVEWRLTDWSEPSDVVIVSQTASQILAGSAVPPKMQRVDERRSFAKEEPTGTLAVSEWVPEYAVDVPAEKEVALGTVLNFTTQADVLHPINLQIKRIDEFQFKTDAIVLDIRGGETLPGGDEENVIAAPGEFLVIDADGQLRAQNELEDMDEFRLKLLMPNEEELEPEDYGATYGDDSGTDDYDGGGIYGPSPGTGSGRGSSDDCS